MVKIVYRIVDGKKQYGIVDEQSKKMFYWTDWKWSKKETNYDYNASLRMEDGGDDATFRFLKSIDQLKSELPISLEDSDIYIDTEYTGYTTNDACDVPKCEFTNVSFKTDDGKAGTFLFQENSEPWFQGDVYEFCRNEWVAELDFDMPKFKKNWSWDDPVEKQKEKWLKYNAYRPDEWKELSGNDLKKFFDMSINVLIKQYEDEIKKKENKKKAAEAKKKTAAAKLDDFAKLLKDGKIRNAYVEYAEKYKIKDDNQLMELVNLLNRTANKKR